MSTPTHPSAPWRPTHRAMLYSIATRTVQTVLVMLTEQGYAYTRHEWQQGLEPSLQQDERGRWWIGPDGPLAAVSTGMTLKVVPLETPTDARTVAA